MTRIFIIGNLGRDPELRYTPTGLAITSFSVASNHIYKDKLGMKSSDPAEETIGNGDALPW